MATATELENYTATELENYTATDLEQTFATASAATSRLLFRFFFHDGTDYKSYLLSVSPIVRDAHQVTAGEVTVRLANTDNTWNTFLSDKTNLYKAAILKIGCPAKKTLFTGFSMDVSYEGAECVLTLRDNMARMLEKKVGSEESPVDYYSSSYNPADLVWDLLITHGGLDSTTSTANTDIDYTQWSIWKSDCAALLFSLEARPTGQTIGELLQKIAHLSQSFIYVDGTGKFTFYRFLPVLDLSPYSITSSLYLVDPEPRVDLDPTRLCNDVTCYYDYDQALETWAGNNTASDATSKAAGWGTIADVMEDIIVWHATSASSQEYCNRRIEIYAYPLELLTFDMPLMGANREIGERLEVTMAMPGNYSTEEFEVWKVRHDTFKNASSRIIARNCSGDIVSPFRLDDAVYGLLDKSYNPLY